MLGNKIPASNVGGKTLELENKINVSIYTNASQIGAENAADFKELTEKMPVNSEISYEVTENSIEPFLDTLPSKTGTVTITKSGSDGKSIIEYIDTVSGYYYIAVVDPSSDHDINFVKITTEKELGKISDLAEGITSTTIVGAVNETFQLGNERKQQLVSNLIAMGVEADTSDSWESLLGNVLNIFTGIDVSADTVTAATLLNGFTAHSADGSAITGSMPNNGAITQSLEINGSYTIPEGYHDGAGVVNQTIPTKAAATITPGTANQTIAAGQYLSGIQTILGDADLVSTNIKSGANIFGVAGNSNVIDTSAGTATAAQILSGQKAAVDGTMLTGTMTNRSGSTLDAGAVTSDTSYTYLSIPSNGFYNTSSRLRTLNSNLSGLANTKEINYLGTVLLQPRGGTVTGAVSTVAGRYLVCTALEESNNACAGLGIQSGADVIIAGESSLPARGETAYFVKATSNSVVLYTTGNCNITWSVTELID